jgi:hypothetical protein
MSVHRARVPAQQAALAGVFALLIACAREQPRPLLPSPDIAPAVYVDSTLDRPHLRYAGDQVTLNDQCPVRHTRLNPRLKPAMVNGHLIGFC